MVCRRIHRNIWRSCGFAGISNSIVEGGKAMFATIVLATVTAIELFTAGSTTAVSIYLLTKKKKK